MENKGISPVVLNLGSWRGWVVHFMPWLFWLQERTAVLIRYETGLFTCEKVLSWKNLWIYLSLYVATVLSSLACHVARCLTYARYDSAPPPQRIFLHLKYFHCSLLTQTSSSSMLLQVWQSLGLLDNSLPFKAVLYLFCPLHKLHLLQIIPDIIFPSKLGPSCWTSCEWFPFVYSFYYANFGHSIYVSKPTQSLGFNIIYYVPVFN